MGEKIEVFSPAELVELLRSPFGLEEAATAATPMLTVDLSESLRGLDEATVGDLVELLQSVRAVTVGILTEPVTPEAESAVAGFDVLLADADSPVADSVVAIDALDDALAALSTAIAANPQAAVAMGQLLRQRTYQSVPNGLVAESLTYSMLQSGPEFGAWLTERGPAAVPADEAPPVLAERIDSTLHITLNRPRRANAVSAGLRDALVEQLRVAAIDPSIDGVILRGNGRAFCAGGDLAEFGSTPDPATGHATRLTRSAGWWVHRLAPNVRVHLHGACIGAGIEVPSFAGTVLAAEDTRIRLPEVAMGLVPGAGGTCSMPRRIGPHRTVYLAITGRELDAAQALRWGLVDRIET